MADTDKLWFELGVRDEISKVLDELMRKSEKLADSIEDNIRSAFDAIGEEADDKQIEAYLKNFYKNVLDIANVFDKIHVTQKRINTAMSETGNKAAKKSFSVMLKELESLEKKYNELTKNPGDLTEAGKVQAIKTKDAIELLIKDSLRYVDTVEAQDAAEERNAKNESRRIDELKAKYYELQWFRKQMSDAIVNATPGTDLSGSISLVNSISARMGAVKRAMQSGAGLPASASGSDYDEFLRKVKAELKGLTTATEDYNNGLKTNEQLQRSLSKLVADTESQKKIAYIRRQSNEYASLSAKLQEIRTLETQVANEHRGIMAGSIVKPTYTNDKIAQELDAIQRRYNESLALGRQREIDDANAKNQKTAASRKAMEAVSALAHVNQGLVSSYDRVAEAGSKANRINIQIQHQIGQYAGLYGLERILKSVVTIGGQFEFQHRALQNILGDVQEANTLFSQLEGLAVESPKTFMELTSYAKQLSAYQIPANELYDTTRRLADLSTGLGVDMSRLILAYGQVRSAAVLRGQELRQFTEAGIPMVQALAEKFTQMNGKLTTTSDVFKLISQRAVSFEMVRDVIWEMTNQGGQFYNMQNELADTLYGKYQKLQDSWQIMLGHIADGESQMGTMLRWMIEGAVYLVNTLDSVVPILASIGVGKMLGGLTQSINSAYKAQTGLTAIRNMEIAKLQQANTLERERVMYGRQLTAQEAHLVATKNQLLSREYALLAQTGKLNNKKTQQLINEGKISRYTLMRLAMEQGITKEKIRQMSVSEVAGAVGLFPNQGKGNGFGKNLLNFLGGPWGAAIAAIGTGWTIFQTITAENEELARQGDAMMSHAQQNANSLAKTLNSVEADGTTEKKIEALEESLISLGSTGEAIVAKSREHLDDVNKRWETLKEGAEEYKKVLESMGNQEGKALFEKAIDDSDIESSIGKYDDAVNKMIKQESGLLRFEQIYKDAIASIISSNEGLAKSVEGKNLFEQIQTIGQKRLYDEIYINRNNKYGALNSAAISSLNAYFNKILDVDKKWGEITDERIPKMGDALRAAAKKIGIENFDNLTPQQKQSLETLTREYVKAIETGSVEAKNKLAEELARQVFRIQIVGDLTVDKTPMSSFAKFVWKKFGGEEVGDDGSVNIGNKLYNKSQVSAIFGDVGTFSKQYNSEWKSLNDTVKKLNKAGATELAKTANQDADDIKSVLDALNLFEPKSKKGGSKKDTVLDAAKTRLEAVKDFYSEWKKYRDQYGEARATSMAEQIFGMTAGEGDKIVKNYRETLRKILASVPQDSEQRKRFGLSIKKLIGDMDLEDTKREAQKVAGEIQRILTSETEKFNLYKTLFDKTGNKEFAMSAFFGGQVWDDAAKNMSAELQGLMEKNVNEGGTIRLNWDADEGTAKQYFKNNFKNADALYDVWKKIVDLIRRNYTESLERGADGYAKIMTASEKVLKIEQELEELRRNGATNYEIAAKKREQEQAKRDAFRESNDYLNFYDAILSLTIPEAEKIGQKIRENLNEELKAGKVSARQYLTEIKKIDEQMEKLRNGKSNLSAFLSGGLNGLYENMKKVGDDQRQRGINDYDKANKDFGKSVSDFIKAYESGNESGMATANEQSKSALATMQGAQSMIKGGQAMSQGAANAKASMQAVDKMVHMIDGIVQGIKGTFDEIREMYDALGYDTEGGDWQDWNTALSSFSSASSSATKGWDSFKNGDFGGALQGVVGSFTGWITGIAKGWDAKMDYRIKVAQQQLAATNRLRDSMERVFNRTLGGVYEYRTSQENLEKLEKARDRTEKVDAKTYKQRAAEAPIPSASGFAGSVAGGAIGLGAGLAMGAMLGSAAGPIGAAVGAVIGGLIGGFLGNNEKYTVNYYKDDTIEKMNEAIESGSYFDEQLALLYKQRDELQHQLDAEQDEKDSDDEKIEDYKEQIAEVKDEIEHFAEDMAKALWNIDVQDWASQLGDALFEAWQKGKDGAEAFKKKSAEIMADLAKNLATKKLIEVAMKPVLKAITDEMERTDGLLDATSTERISASLAVVGSTLPDSFNTLLDAIDAGMQRAGLTSMKDLDSSSSTGSSIKDISENTANLLASYINAIRADVSVNRSMIAQYYPRFLDTLSQGNVIANSQLTQLTMIAENTNKNVGLVLQIYELLHRVAPDGTSIRVK